MRMQNKIATASFMASLALAAALASLPASAQQGPRANWDGFYGGLNAGGTWLSTSETVNMNNTTGAMSGVGNGVLGGATLGYNYMLNSSILLGAEIDFQGSTATSNINGAAGASTINAVTKTPWFSTMRARAGYMFNGVAMPYITGGAVWGRETIDGNVSDMGAFSASSNFWTWTVGGGIEGVVADRWTAKLEYLYIGTPDTLLAPPAATAVSGSAVGNVIRAGVNYHF